MLKFKPATIQRAAQRPGLRRWRAVSAQIPAGRW